MSLPLQGKHILVTREKTQAKTLTQRVEQGGGISIEIPLLTFNLISSEQNRVLLHHLESFDWLFFTSANGVKFFFQSLDDSGISHQVVQSLKIAAVGEKTAGKLHEYGFKPNLIPNTYDGEHLGEAFNMQRNEPVHVLLIQGSRSRPTLFNQLQKKGITPRAVTVYETKANVTIETELHHLLNGQSLDALTFTSPSAVESFVSLAGDHMDLQLFQLPCACIGATTKDKAASLGFQNLLVPENYIVEAMVEELERYFSEKG